MWSLSLLLICMAGGGEPLTLEAALTRALTWNREQRRANLSVVDAEARLDLEREAFRWGAGNTLTANDSGARSAVFSVDKLWRTGTELDLTSAVDLGDDPTLRYRSDHRLTLSQPLLAQAGPLVQEKGLRTAQLGVLDAREALRESRQSLVFRVVRDYYQVLLEARLAALSRKSLERVEKLVEATRLKLRIGRVSQVDLYRAQLLENDTRLELLQRETALAAAGRALMVLIGAEDTAAPPLVTPEMAMPLGADVDWTRFDQGYRQTLRYGRLERRLKESQLDVRLADRAGLPDLRLNVSVYADRVDDVLDFGGEQDDGVELFLSQSHNFRRRDVRVRRQLAENRVTALGYDLEDVRVDYQRELHDRIQNLQLTERRLALNESALSFANEQQEVAESRFERGLIDNFDVIEAEQRVLSAGNALARTRRDLVLQWLALKIFLNVLDPDRPVNMSQLLFVD